MSIQGIKLASGEEVFAEVRTELDYYVLSKPLRPIVTPEGVQLVPWMLFSSQNEFKIDRKDVVFTYDLRSEVSNAYREQTTGLVVAGAGDLSRIERSSKR
jgi:hypothetical protein